MDDLWAIPAEIPLTQALHLPTASAKCPEDYYGEDFACRICAELPPGGFTMVDPVNVYRLWNRYHQDAMERLHFPTPWRIVEPFLQQHGYRLKTRADLNCPPSLLEPGESTLDPTGLLFSPVSPLKRDNKVPAYSAHTYPAFNREGVLVYIKTVPLHSPEFDVWRALSTEPLRSDPYNHSVPVIDVMLFRPNFSKFGYENQAADARAFVVMRAMEQLAPPTPRSQSALPLCPFLESLQDIEDMSLQLAQGLRFMHRHGLAHLDLSMRNVVWEKVDSGRRYYFIDYQYSRYFRPSSEVKPSVSETFYPLPERLAEHKDPYAIDVYRFGLMIRMVLDIFRIASKRKERPELISLRTLVGGIMQKNPAQRPKMDTVEHDISEWIRSGIVPATLV